MNFGEVMQEIHDKTGADTARLAESLRYIMYHRTPLGETLIEMVPEPKRGEITAALGEYDSSRSSTHRAR